MSAVLRRMNFAVLLTGTATLMSVCSNIQHIRTYYTYVIRDDNDDAIDLDLDFLEKLGQARSCWMMTFSY